MKQFAARLGQPFSTTTYVKIEGEQLSARPDIKRNGYTFTDGVGVCSQDVVSQADHFAGFPLELKVIPTGHSCRQSAWECQE